MIVQYIFLISDIKSIKKGSLIAQACHASIKAIHVYKDKPDTQKYLESIDSMTKIILKIKQEDVLKIQDKLAPLDLVEWIEQPENIVTCLALRPYNIGGIQDFLSFIKQYKLF